MNTQILLHKFSQAIHWNAFLYLIYKTSSVILTSLFFYYLSTADFSCLATINSAIYLLLIWTDSGFRKSIPRFSPLFAKNKAAFITFTKATIIFQLSLLLCVSLILYHLLPWFFVCLHHTRPLSSTLRTLTVTVFITEGLVDILRLSYHAHFLNKQFNLVATIIRIIETIINLFLISFIQVSTTLLIAVFITKLVGGVAIIIGALLMLKTLYNDRNYQGTHDINTKDAWYHFIKHSIMMWINNTLKSFSERNFLVPLLTFLLGQQIANLFKIAQDWALLFERSILKTIGVSDTALLAHAEMGSWSIDLAFKKLMHKVIGLCIPLFGIITLIFINGRYIFGEQTAFQTFLLLAITYLIEVLLSPYERMLEVKQRYLLLMVAYAPYIVGVLFLFYSIPFIGLQSFILIMQGVRLVSSFIMSWFAYRNYHLSFPWDHLIRLVVIWLMIVVGISVICKGLSPYIMHNVISFYPQRT